MCKLWVLGGLAAVLSAGGFGCYLDQLQAEQRANRVLQEDLGRARNEVVDQENLNKQKQTQLDAQKQEIDAKEQTVASMTLENEKLRGSLANAEKILEKMAGNTGSTSILVKRESALPPALSNALADFAKKYAPYVEFDPKTGTVRWKTDLMFPLGSDTMTTNPELVEAMQKFAEIVNSPDAAGFDVAIVGYTCNTPIKRAETKALHKTNWHLSTHRAICVMNMLGEDGVTQSRMGVMGYGEYRPIADNSTKEGRSKNRRVEIYLVQKDGVQSLGQPGVYADQDITYGKPSEMGTSTPKPTPMASPVPKTAKKPTKSMKTAPQHVPTTDQ